MRFIFITIFGEIVFNQAIIRSFNITRMKTSIRYAKENDRDKRERKKGRRRDIEREGEIR